MTYDDDINKILADQEKSRHEKQQKQQEQQSTNHVNINKNNERRRFY